MSSALVWELVKNSNAFLRAKGPDGTVFSAEPGNLANKNSFKYSGLASRTNTVDISEVDGAVAFATSSRKKAGKLNTSIVKKNARRTVYAAGAIAASVRPDLKRAAQARASAISKGLRARKPAAESA